MPRITAKVVLLLPGALAFTPLVLAYVATADFIIAVDGGMIHANQLPRTPDIWVGDFDSTKQQDEDLLSRYADVQRLEFPCDKDFLDTEIALKIAIEQGAEECILLGGMGGRLDHALALHLMPLQFPNLRFIHTDGKTTALTIHGDAAHEPCQQKIAISLNQTFSLIPLQDCFGIEMQGAKWSSGHLDLKQGSGCGLSNIAVSDSLQIRLNQGLLWCVFEDKNMK